MNTIPRTMQPGRWQEEQSGDAVQALSSPLLNPMFWTPHRIGTPSAWWAHVPFAFWITAVCRPRLLVELGTHHGVSYAAFCESVVRSQLATRCYAVDTWSGDAHSESYDEGVLGELRQFHDRRYGAFSELLRMTFDAAAQQFEEGSIDLLHIDGFHTYDAVRHDFETWLPKLSEHAVVLFHDTNVREKDFGVWKFWSEVSARYPSFEFQHGYGLGILAVGAEVPGRVRELCALSDHAAVAAIRERFSVIGSRWTAETREQIGIAHISAQMQQREVELGQRLAQTDQEKSALQDRVQELSYQSEQAVERVRKAGSVHHRRIAAIRRGVRLTAVAAGAPTDGSEAAGLRSESTVALLRSQYQRIDDAASRSAVSAFARKCALVGRAMLRSGPAGMKSTLRQIREIDAVRSSAFFDPAWYRSTYPDVGISKLDPAEHYVRFGAREGRDPGPFFSTQRYLTDNADVARASVAPLGHFERVGRKEGRAFPIPLAQEKPAVAAVRPVAGRVQRIVFLSGEPDTPGNRYRVQRLAHAAGLAGGPVHTVRIDQLHDQRTVVHGADLLIIWRAPWDEQVEAAIVAVRRRGGRIVFDVDDLMVDPEQARVEVIDGIRTQSVTESAVQEHYARIRRTMMAADFCTTTTEELAYFMRLGEKPTVVLPNGFDLATYNVSQAAAARWRRERNDNLVRIGYAGGSRTHQRDLGLAMPAIARILNEHADCRLVLFRSRDGKVPLVDLHEFPCLEGLDDRIEWRPLQPLEDLPNEMARFDINLAPLEFGNPFCEAKSELKFFEAALVGVPTVASPTGPFRRAIEHGRTGYLASNGDDWYLYLNKLIDDSALRGRIAHDAHISTLAKFGPVRRARDYAGLIDQVRGGIRGTRAFALAARLASEPWRPPKVYPSDVVFEAGGACAAEVTVAIPLYNYESHVVEALESVRAQTLRPLDLVVVDGCSTDDSLAVARAWVARNAERFNRVVVLRNRDNYGLGFCRNSGLDAARTPFVMLLDADNRLRPECCSRLLELIKSSGSAFAYSRIQQFGASVATISNFPFDPQRFAAGNYIDAMALVAREAWAIIGGYDHVRFGWEDYDFWTRLSEHGFTGAWTPEVLSDYRVHQTSMMTTQTMAGQNYRTLIGDFMRRHPWVSLVDRQRKVDLSVPPADPAPKGSARKSRLETILPLMKCPETGLKLMLDPQAGRLVSLDGWRKWPVVEGRPVMIAGMDKPEVRPVDHVSNQLAPKALELIESTKGLVLNLSAGGSMVKYPHVIEVEHAIFRHTDLVADAHALPFDDQTFEAVIVMNAFEHYSNPPLAASEIYRVLKPGGRVLVHTAFMQPQHEAPWHFYNCTRYGLAEWFKAFTIDQLHVSENFNPNHSVAWLASECESLLRAGVSAKAADNFSTSSIGSLVTVWRDPSKRDVPLWKDFTRLAQKDQEAVAAGFELLARRPEHTFSVRPQAKSGGAAK